MRKRHKSHRASTSGPVPAEVDPNGDSWLWESECDDGESVDSELAPAIGTPT